MYEGHARSRLGVALMPAIARFALPKDAFVELIEGMAMDADRPIVAPDMRTLELYCHRVAGTVGLCASASSAVLILSLGGWLARLGSRSSSRTSCGM